MDKNEVLEKSRRENRVQDEMERQIRIEGESFSTLVTMVVGIGLLVWKITHGLPRYDILAMFWATSMGCALYRLAVRRQKGQIVVFLISLLLLVYNITQFIQA